MLITSRTGQHWIPPKGKLMKGRKPHQAAAQEAFEEAGVIGRISKTPLGVYRGFKSRTDGRTDPLSVTVFPMRVVDREEDFPERGQRSSRWGEEGVGGAGTEEKADASGSPL